MIEGQKDQMLPVTASILFKGCRPVPPTPQRCQDEVPWTGRGGGKAKVKDSASQRLGGQKPYSLGATDASGERALKSRHALIVSPYKTLRNHSLGVTDASGKRALKSTKRKVCTHSLGEVLAYGCGCGCGCACGYGCTCGWRQKTRPQNGETAWPGRFNGPIFETHFSNPRCQNVTFQSTKL